MTRGDHTAPRRGVEAGIRHQPAALGRPLTGGGLRPHAALMRAEREGRARMVRDGNIQAD